MLAYSIIGYMVIGGNFAIRRDVVERMGGFVDPVTEFYGDDTIIARRAHKFGKILFSPDFVISTSGRRINKGGLFTTAFAYAKNYVAITMGAPPTREYKDFR